MTLRIGYLGARGDARGLAAQSQGFCKWLQPARILGIDMYAEDLSPYENDWSPFVADGADLTILTRSAITENIAKSWMKGLDVILGAETFYNEMVPVWAREVGVRTVCQINPEFAPWWNANLRGDPPPKPDVLVVPTTWMMSKMSEVVHLPCPVDREVFPFRLRTSAEHFVHPAGHRAMMDRAGTRMILGVVRHAREARITIRTQTELGIPTRRFRGNVTVEHDNLSDPRKLYEDADVVLAPRRYGGQHLGVNEALSSGCPVIMLDREPENQWEGVVTVPSRVRRRMPTQFGGIEWYDGSVAALGNRITQLQERPEWVQELSRAANKHAESISWDTLLPAWMDLLSCK